MKDHAPPTGKLVELAEKTRMKRDKNRGLSSDKPLDDRQLLFCNLMAQHGMTQRGAARAAGYPEKQLDSVLYRFTKSQKIIDQIAFEREKYAKASMMTKQRVMEGFLEAIDVGRLKADSIAMTSGWREIAKMCGYFEPTRHKLEVSVSGEVVIQKLQALTDQDLLKLADGQAEALEGEFKVIQAD